MVKLYATEGIKELRAGSSRQGVAKALRGEKIGNRKEKKEKMNIDLPRRARARRDIEHPTSNEKQKKQKDSHAGCILCT